MDVAQALIRMTVRSFFTVKHSLIIDALIIHSVLTTDDFTFLLGQQTKDVRKLLHPLKQARLLSTQSRQESRDGYQKAYSREYYYIPLHPAIDAIKYKVWKLQNKVQELYKPNEERKEWKCNRCGSEWTELEVLDSVGPHGFECHKCHGPLDRAANAQGDANTMAGHEKQALLQKQIARLVKLMQQIDSQEIPENDFESAWERKKDVPREEGIGTRRAMIPVGKGHGFGRSGPRVEQTDTNKFIINLSNAEELNETERREAEQKKATLLAQNQLPIWHRESAIGMGGNSEPGESTTNGFIKADPVSAEEKPKIDSMDDEMAAVYAEMERERQRNAERAAMAAQDAEDDEDDEDDDDDEDFEDVPSTGIGTPLPSSQGATNGVKRERDTGQGLESGSSTTVNTPAADTPNAKRVKMQSTTTSSSAAVEKEEDSDEDEEDFEDAM
ncbi:putative transcription factor tfiie complex alpha [Phaeomoniella chlamydospora]|uniref:Putative transcription factor tfiie complex alpha n=1 Tax=Phaeomoniella chlamydospora TaxID=158046 RepID=A0A0G2GKR7_PHACM|nr:putative transcription factor tfiie complex alpha [Phaeomoniella chlamydospora]